jgi:sec-independent protein translocase protein TatB
MQIFNIGPLEFILILVLALLVLGPKNMVKTAYEVGRWINKVVRSPMWATLISTSREIRQLPTKIVQDTGLEDSLKQIKDETEAVTKELNSEVNKSVDSINSAVQDINNDVKVEIKAPNANTLLPGNGQSASGKPTGGADAPKTAPEPEPLPSEEARPVRTAFEAAGLSGDELNVLPEDEPLQSAWQAAGLPADESPAEPATASSAEAPAFAEPVSENPAAKVEEAPASSEPASQVDVPEDHSAITEETHPEVPQNQS